MNNKWLQAGVAALAITSVIAATSPTFAQGKEARMRIVHASPDAPKVDVFVNGKLAFKDVFFKEITPYEAFQPGDIQIQVVPHGKTVKDGPVVLDTKTKLEAGKDYSIIASGMLNKIAPVVLTDTPSAAKKGDAWVRLVNVSTAMPERDMTAMPNVNCSFLVVPTLRGQQLKDPAQLDGWLRDGSAAYIESLCEWR